MCAVAPPSPRTYAYRGRQRLESVVQLAGKVAAREQNAVANAPAVVGGLQHGVAQHAQVFLLQGSRHDVRAAKV